MFIRLTQAFGGAPVLINIATISDIAPSSDDEKQSRIGFSDGSSWMTVQESLDEIQQLIENPLLRNRVK